MDIERVIQTRANRQSRTGRPFAVFNHTFAQCLDGGRFVISEPESKHSNLLKRAVVISMVSAIEVYYKDVLDLIFRVCSPSFFEPHIKRIHGTKYDIEDLIEFHRRRIHPLELIAANQSFQNADTIDSVFSRFLGKSIWSAVFGMQVRVKNDPKTEVTYEASLLADLKRLFAMRHEFVHDPAMNIEFSQDTIDLICAAAFLISGTDVILMGMINDNADPELIPKAE
jgi:hypothetical protein